jgi:hypothetical protein
MVLFFIMHGRNLNPDIVVDDHDFADIAETVALFGISSYQYIFQLISKSGNNNQEL